MKLVPLWILYETLSWLTYSIWLWHVIPFHCSWEISFFGALWTRNWTWHSVSYKSSVSNKKVTPLFWCDTAAENLWLSQCHTYVSHSLVCWSCTATFVPTHISGRSSTFYSPLLWLVIACMLVVHCMTILGQRSCGELESCPEWDAHTAFAMVITIFSGGSKCIWSLLGDVCTMLLYCLTAPTIQNCVL